MLVRMDTVLDYCTRQYGTLPRPTELIEVRRYQTESRIQTCSVSRTCLFAQPPWRGRQALVCERLTIPCTLSESGEYSSKASTPEAVECAARWDHVRYVRISDRTIVPTISRRVNLRALDSTYQPAGLVGTSF